MKHWNALRHSTLGLCLALFAGHPALADDTEIFVGQSLDSGLANVLFLIDTSGSMGAKVNWDPVYDPNITYDGNCPADRIYYFSDTNPRGNCGSEDAERYTDAGSFVCQAAMAGLNTDGKHTDRYAMFRTNNDVSKRDWQNLKRHKPTRLVECEDDNGIHGDGTSDIYVYPAEEEYATYGSEPNGPKVLDWSNRSTWTAVTGNYMNFYYSVGTQG
ncbi:MAG: hypothetical protein HKN49_06630, partial [Gammaproteobacteria bacterium]|nr:hypothetical protein [Gammaproteobacteria bacterium]